MLSLFIKFAAWWELSAQRFPIFPSQWSRRTCGGPVAQVYMECVRASRCFPDQKKRLLGFLASSSLTPIPSWLTSRSVLAARVRGTRGANRGSKRSESGFDTQCARSSSNFSAKYPCRCCYFLPGFLLTFHFPFDDFLPGEETRAVLERVPCPKHTHRDQEETRVTRHWQVMKSNTRRLTEWVNMESDKPKER